MLVSWYKLEITIPTAKIFHRASECETLSFTMPSRETLLLEQLETFKITPNSMITMRHDKQVEECSDNDIKESEQIT